MPRKVFISYRVADTRSTAGRLAADLRRIFGEEAVFLDHRSLDPGEQWPERLQREVSGAAVLLALIGKGWLTVQNEYGRRRIDVSEDWVRQEIAAALRGNGKVLPLLVNDAKPIPAAAIADLPDIAKLATAEALPLRDLDWETDVQRLTDWLQEQGFEHIASSVAHDDVKRAIPQWRGNPFRGLSPFGPDDAPIYHGRERETDELLHRVEAERLVAVIGRSGSGKSSLVAAGLIPQLDENWLCVRFTPAEAGDNPLRALALKLAPKLSSATSVDVLADRFRTEREAIDPLAAEALADRPAGAQLLLFIDQFEELFSDRVDDAYREPFIDAIAAAALSKYTRLVFTLRADYFEHCTRYEALTPHLRVGTFPLGAPGVTALQKMIERPAQAAGLQIEPALVERILDDAGTEPGALALVEFTLEQLYEARRHGTLTLAAYEGLGGVGGAIETQGEKAVREPGGQVDNSSLGHVFRALAAVDEHGRAVRQQATREDLAAAETVIADRLVNGRLLVAGTDAEGRSTVEVAHEAVFRHWRRFRKWLDENREFMSWRTRLRSRISEWARQDREPSGLLRGKALAEALQWEAHFASYMDRDERKYISLSREAEVTEDQKWQRLYQDSERRKEEAIARQLSARADAILYRDQSALPLVALLATEAIRRFPHSEASTVLRSALMTMAAAPSVRLALSERVSPFGCPVVRPSRTSSLVAVAASSDLVSIFDMETGELKTRIAQEHAPWPMALGVEDNLVALWGNMVRVFDWREEKEVLRFKLPEQMTNAELNKTAEYVIAHDGPRSQVYSVATGQLTATITSSKEITARYVRDSSKYVAVVCEAGVEIYELASGVLAGDAPLTDIASITFSESEELVALASKSGLVEVRRLGTNFDLVATLKCGAEATAAVFAPDDQWIATGTKGDALFVQIWDLPSGTPAVSIPVDDDVRMLAVSADGKLLVSQAGFWSRGDKKEALLARVWDTDSGSAVARLAHGKDVLLVHFVTPRSVATVSAVVDVIGRRQGPTTLTTWIMDTKPMLYSLRHKNVTPDSVTASEGDVILVRINWSIYPWAPGGGEPPIEPLSDCFDFISGVASSPEREYQAIWGTGGIDVLGDRFERLSRIPVRERVNDVAIGPRGETLAVCLWSNSTGEDGFEEMESKSADVLVLDARTGELVRVLTHQPSVPMAVHRADGETEIRKFPNGVDTIAISCDGRLLATYALDRNIRVWDLSSGEVVWQIEARVDRMIFAGGSLVVAAGDLIRIWDPQSGTERANLIQDARVKDIKCDAAGRFIVVLTYRGQAAIWDLTTATRVIQTAEDEKVAVVDLSADGRHWILGTEGMTGCWLWRPDDLIELAEAYVSRNMSEQEWRNFVGDEPFRANFQLGKQSS